MYEYLVRVDDELRNGRDFGVRVPMRYPELAPVLCALESEAQHLEDMILAYRAGDKQNSGVVENDRDDAHFTEELTYLTDFIRRLKPLEDTYPGRDGSLWKEVS